MSGRTSGTDIAAKILSIIIIFFILSLFTGGEEKRTCCKAGCSSEAVSMMLWMTGNTNGKIGNTIIRKHLFP